MQQAESLKRTLSPYYLTQKVFVTPPKNNFSKYQSGSIFKGIRNYVKRLLNRGEIEAEKEYNLGFKAHVIGKLQDAVSHYKNCLELDGQHFAALNNLAGAYGHMGDFTRARDALEQALFGTRSITMVYYNLGLLFQAMGQPDKAIESLKHALEREPGHFWARVVLAEILVDRVQISDAIQCYHKALAQAPDSYSVNIRLAELYSLQNDYSRAEFILRDCLSHHETPELLYNLAWILTVQNKSLNEAVRLYSQAQRKKAPYHEALFNQAITESINGNFDESLLHMQRYTHASSPGDIPSLIRNFRILARVNGQNVAAVMRIATQLFDDGYDEEAVSELLLLLKRKPDYLPALKLLSQYEYQTGNAEMAVETCHRILEVCEDKDSLETYILLSKIYGAKGEYETAMEFVQQALEINQNLPELNYQYATFLAERGDFAGAMKHYKQVAAISPNYPRINSRIRMVEEELRDTRDFG